MMADLETGCRCYDETTAPCPVHAGREPVVHAMRAEVRADGSVELWQTNYHAVGFAKTKEAMQIIRKELDRLLTEGDTKCPFRRS